MINYSLLFFVSFKAACIEGSDGWPQWVIQWYYTRILSMDPLPWAKSVGPDYGKAQFMEGDASASRPSSSQRPPEPLSTPVMPKARPADPPQNSECTSGEAYYFNHLQKMDPEGRCSEMAQLLSDAQMNDQPMENLLVHMEEIKELIEMMEQAQHMQERTVTRLKKDLSLMEDLSQEMSNNIIEFRQTYEALILMKEAVGAEEEHQKQLEEVAQQELEEAERQAQQDLEQAEREAQEAQDEQDALMAQELEDLIQRHGVSRDKAIDLLSPPPAKKQKSQK